jgi:hypothetical protein
MKNIQTILAAYARSLHIVGSLTSKVAHLDINDPEWDIRYQSLRLIESEVKRHELKLIEMGLLAAEDAQHKNYHTGV